MAMATQTGAVTQLSPAVPHAEAPALPGPGNALVPFPLPAPDPQDGGGN